MMEIDGLDEELFDFLDHIGTISRTDKKDEYKGYDNKRGNYFSKKADDIKFDQNKEIEEELSEYDDSFNEED